MSILPKSACTFLAHSDTVKPTPAAAAYLLLPLTCTQDSSNEHHAVLCVNNIAIILATLLFHKVPVCEICQQSVPACHLGHDVHMIGPSALQRGKQNSMQALKDAETE